MYQIVVEQCVQPCCLVKVFTIHLKFGLSRMIKGKKTIAVDK